MRSAVVFFLLLPLLAACSSLTEQSNSPLAGSTPTLLGQTMPGIDDLDTQTKADKADEDWWNGYYSNK